MWDFEGGFEFTSEVRDRIISKLNENGVLRNLCILGGEPLCPQNAHMTELLCGFARVEYPDINIYVWTGYTLEELCEREQDEKSIHNILDCIDVLVANPFDISKRDITLELRGSSNQEIYKFVTEQEFADGGKHFGFERENTTYPYIIQDERFKKI
jgi:anaerobic ribonucleoside-triphosphate reductase activating protein